MGSGVYLAGTGLPVVNRFVRSAQSVLEEVVLEAREEILIAAYTISENLKDFFGLLERTAARGVSISIVVNRFESQPDGVRGFLCGLKKKYPHVSLFSYDGRGELHMKVVVADRKRALVGSANLTWRGLTENIELCVLIEGKPARTVAEVLEAVINSSRPVDVW